MDIFKGIVTSNQDETFSGKINVICPDFGNAQIVINYTSPYYSKYKGGILAIPDPGAEILFARDGNRDTYYYISTIVSDNPQWSESEKNPNIGIPVVNSKRYYTNDGIPKAIGILDPKGAGLRVSNYGETSPPTLAASVSLKSAAGQLLLLSDSPNTEGVFITNSDGDGLSIVSNRGTDIHAGRSIELKSVGPQNHVTFGGDYNISVIDGKELTIRNSSTGKMKNPASPDKCGNVTLWSDYSDINIFTDGEEDLDGNVGNIFISTKAGIVQIKSGGDIVIIANNGIKIKSGGDMEFQSDGNITFEGNNINLKARSTIQGLGQSGVKLNGGSANVGIQGSQVHLNSPGQAEITIDPIDISDTTNAYGR